MKTQIKVYLDTSVISALFDIRNPERQALTKKFMEQIDTFDACVSEITLAEIDDTKDKTLKMKMKECAVKLRSLPLNTEAQKLAEIYVDNGAIPKSYPEDAMHIAIATLGGIDYLLSWNFKHIVKVKTRNIITMVNASSGYPGIEIITPAELIQGDE